MKTDRELLELAARAYFEQEVADGVCSFWWDEKEQAIVYIHGANQDHNGSDVELLWIPRDDDGDALRLAVKLSIDIKQYGDHVVAWFEGGFIGTGRIQYDGDPCAATRRAILLAAAAIGEAM